MVLLVTSRDTGRWVLPKGWVEKGRTAAEQAAQEAFEEAGILGTVATTPIGRYSYPKRQRSGPSIPCQVLVFPLAVERLLRQWPEKGQRIRRWFSLQTAAGLVAERKLGRVMLRFAG